MLLALGGCVGDAPIPMPLPIQLEERPPPLGLVLSLELEEAGRPLRLEAVVGRVTVLCVLDEEGDPVAEACNGVRHFWGDRIAVVGLATSPRAPAAPFRVYADPGGEALREVLSLGSASRVILTDRRGRVSRLVEAGELELLHRAIYALVG